MIYTKIIWFSIKKKILICGFKGYKEKYFLKICKKFEINRKVFIGYINIKKGLKILLIKLLDIKN